MPQASWPETTFCRGGVPEVPHTHGGALLRGLLWSPPSSAHLQCMAVADATLEPALFRPEMPLHFMIEWIHAHQKKKPKSKMKNHDRHQSNSKALLIDVPQGRGEAAGHVGVHQQQQRRAGWRCCCAAGCERPPCNLDPLAFEFLGFQSARQRSPRMQRMHPTATKPTCKDCLGI